MVLLAVLAIPHDVHGQDSPALSVPITVSTDAGGAQALTLGLDPDATDGIDGALGETEQPPLPPGGIFDARLVDDDIPASGFGQGLTNDIRPGSAGFTGAKEHEIQIQPDSGATQATVTWELPDGVSGTLTDVITGGDLVNASMTGSGTYTLTNLNLDRLYVTLDYTGAANTPPSAADDSVSTLEDSTLVVEAAAGVLANDTDPDGDALTASVETGPSSGTLSLEADGALTYAPDAGFTGTDSFTYEAGDGNGGTDLASVAIAVAPSSGQEPAVSVPLTIAPNAGGADAGAGDTLTLGIDPAATPGIDAAFGETEQPPPPPSSVFDTRLIDEGVPGGPFGQGVRTDIRPGSPDGAATRRHRLSLQPGEDATSATVAWALPDGVTGQLQDVATGGSLVDEPMVGDGAYTLTNLNVTELDVTLAYGAPNTPPTAAPDAYSTVSGRVLQVPAAGGVLVNDTDAEDDSLTATLVNGPDNGTLSLGPDGGFSYAPPPDFSGSDSFSYAAADGRGGADTTTATIEVQPGQPPETAFPFTVTADTLTEQLAMGVDPDATPGIDPVLGEQEQPPPPPSSVFDARWVGDDVAASVGQGVRTDIRPADAAFTGTKVYQVDVQPGESAESVTFSWALPDSVSGRLQDVATGGDVVDVPMAGTDTYTLSNLSVSSLTVTLNYGPPTAKDDAFSILEDSTLTVAPPGVLANDTDGGDSLAAALVSGPESGSLSLAPSGAFAYTPAPNATDSVAFVYEATDPLGQADRSTVTVGITPVNDAPTITAIPDTALSPADSTTGPLPFSIDDIDTPVDSLALTATTSDSTIVPPSGLALGGSDTSRTVTVTPAPNVDGSSTITVAVNDGEASASTSFAVTATAISNAPPVVETPIPDDTLLAPGPPLRLLNLEGSIFEDPDGTGLSFAASTDAPSVVQVLGQSPAAVLLKPQASGTAQVTLTATDAQGATVRDTFAVAVEARSPGAPQPVEAARSFVAASDSAALPLGSTGASARLQNVTAGGAVEARFFTGADTAAAPAFVPADSFDTVSPYRWVIETDDVDFASASVAFSLQDTSVTGVGAPQAVSVVRDAEGDGEIEEVLETSFVAADSALVAEGVTDFSTFRLASNDADNPLPVELVDFAARPRDDGALLEWQTASETNNAGFEVQHSGPGTDGFETVAFVESQAAGGTTTAPQRYRYTVSDVAPGAHTFQLRQVDVDGTGHLSAPTSLTVRMRAPLRLTPPAPNPARTKAQFQIGVREAGAATVTLYNILGQQVATLYRGRPTPGEMTTVRLQGPQLRRLSSGVYFVRGTSQGHTRVQRLVIVQ